MSVAYQYYDATLGAYPVAASANGVSTTFTVASTPAGNSSDAFITDELSITSGKSVKLSTSCTGLRDDFASSYAGGYPLFRRYYFLTAAPTSDFSIAMRTNAVWSQWQTLGISTDLRFFGQGYQTAGALSDRNPVASGAVTSAANAVPLNEWFRVDGYIPDGATNWKIAASIYKSSGAGLTSTGTADVSIEIGELVGLGNPGGMWFGAWSYGSGSFAPRTFLSSPMYMDYASWAVGEAQPAPVTPYGPLSLPVAGASFAGIVPI